LKEVCPFSVDFQPEIKIVNFKNIISVAVFFILIGTYNKQEENNFRSQY
jgi:hypothetical protein